MNCEQPTMSGTTTTECRLAAAAGGDFAAFIRSDSRIAVLLPRKAPLRGPDLYIDRPVRHPSSPAPASRTEWRSPRPAIRVSLALGVLDGGMEEQAHMLDVAPGPAAGTASAAAAPIAQARSAPIHADV